MRRKFAVGLNPTNRCSSLLSCSCSSSTVGSWRRLFRL